MSVSLFCKCIIFVALVPALLLVSFPGWPDIYAMRRFVQMAVLVVLTLSLFWNNTFFRQYRRELLVLLMLLMLALLSSRLHSTSDHYVADLFFIPFYLLAILIFASWLQACDLRQLTKYLLIIVVAMEFIYAVLTLLLYLLSFRGDGSEFADAIPWGYVNIRYWSHIATWLLPLMPLALNLGVRAMPSMWRPMVYLAAGTIWWLVIESVARGTLLAMSAAFVAVLLLAGRRALPWIRGLAEQAAVGVMLWLLLSWCLPHLVSGEAPGVPAMNFSSSGRIPLWHEAWEMSLQFFPLGVGAQSWLTHEGLTTAYANGFRFGHPHNMYLMWAAEYGWLYVLLLALLASLALRGRQQSTRLQAAVYELGSDTTCAFMGACIAAVVHAGVSGVFWSPASMLVGLPVIAILVAMRAGPAPFEALGKSKSLSGRLVLIALVGLLLFWQGHVIAYYRAMKTDLEQIESDRTLAPRFWVHGDYPR